MLTNSRKPHFSTEIRPEYWQCERKKAYQSGRHARNAAGFATSRGGKLIEAYKCPHCKGWHIGKPMKKRGDEDE